MILGRRRQKTLPGEELDERLVLPVLDDAARKP
jgi:hypothetical protein